MLAVHGMNDIVGWMGWTHADVVRHDEPEAFEAIMQRRLH